MGSCGCMQIIEGICGGDWKLLRSVRGERFVDIVAGIGVLSEDRMHALILDRFMMKYLPHTAHRYSALPLPF